MYLSTHTQCIAVPNSGWPQLHLPVHRICQHETRAKGGVVLGPYCVTSLLHRRTYYHYITSICLILDVPSSQGYLFIYIYIFNVRSIALCVTTCASFHLHLVCFMEFGFDFVENFTHLTKANVKTWVRTTGSTQACIRASLIACNLFGGTSRRKSRRCSSVGERKD